MPCPQPPYFAQCDECLPKQRTPSLLQRNDSVFRARALDSRQTLFFSSVRQQLFF